MRFSTGADGQDRSGRSTRLKRSTQFAGSGVRLARPACAMMQASVVEGIMACHDESRRLSPRHKDRSQGHFPITKKIQKFVEVPRIVQRLSRSPRDPEDREDSTTDPARSEPRGPDRPSEVGRGPDKTRPSEVRALRVRQDPARSEPCCKPQLSWSVVMSWVFMVVQGFEHHELRRATRESPNERFRVCEEQTRTCATAQRPECQQARAPLIPTLPRLFFRAAGVTFQLPREGASGLSFCGVLSPSLLSSFVFPCWFPGSCLEAGEVRSSHFGHPRG